MINIDQSPIGRTPRSNPATYTGVFDHIRQLFAKTKEARARGYQPGRFSFNVKGGRCEVCKGDGQIKIEMHFLPDVYVPCEQCNGRRYNRETLEVRFKGKSIADVLEMPVDEAVDFFAKIPKIHRRLKTLHDVGLGYIRLGQPATTLSGGEAQRVKLASELSKIATGETLYILDEPTTGLHFADVERLLDVLSRLVDAGNTVVVIEHNLDVIKSADWVVDLGPEGGDGGGEIIAAGTPEQIVTEPASYTGRFLEDLVEPKLERTADEPPSPSPPESSGPARGTARHACGLNVSLRIGLTRKSFRRSGPRRRRTAPTWSSSVRAPPGAACRNLPERRRRRGDRGRRPRRGCAERRRGGLAHGPARRDALRDRRRERALDRLARILERPLQRLPGDRRLLDLRSRRLRGRYDARRPQRRRPRRPHRPPGSARSRAPGATSTSTRGRRPPGTRCGNRP